MMRSCWLAIAVSACGGNTRATDAGGDDAPAIDAAVPMRFVAYVSGGADIAWYDVDQATGALAPISSIAAFRPGASFLAFRGTNLYAVTSGNRVGAYAIDPATGGLTFINDVATGGIGPAHVAVDRGGGFVFVANYNDGSVSVLPVQPGGGLGAAVETVAPGANAHWMDSDRSNRYVFVPCLGADHVAQYQFDMVTGQLTPNAVPRLATRPGAGPRHLAFSTDNQRAYLINERDSTLSALLFDGPTGQLSEQDTVTTRAPGATGPNTTAEVVVHPQDRFIYGSNRGDDNIVLYSMEPLTQRILLIGHTATQGMTPRSIAIDPSGKFLYAANQGSDTVVPFAIDPSTGALSPTAAPVSVPTPAFVGIIALPAP